MIKIMLAYQRQILRNAMVTQYMMPKTAIATADSSPICGHIVAILVVPLAMPISGQMR